MLRLFIGLIFLGLGISPFLNPDIPKLWYIGIIIGIVMIVISIREQIKKRKKTGEDASSVQENMEELLHRLRNRENLHVIAENFYKKKHIIPIRTFLVACDIILEFAKSNDEDHQAFTRQFMKELEIPPLPKPEDQIKSFSFSKNVYYLEDFIELYANPGKETSTNGSLALTEGYLFFFTGLDKGSFHFAKSTQTAFGIAAGGYHLISGISDDLHAYFTYEVIQKLLDRFKLDGSFAIPLKDIESAESFKDESSEPALYLKITYLDGDVERALYFAKENEGEKWRREWVERVQIAGIGENKLIK